MPTELIEKLGQFQDELEKLKKATDEIKDAGAVAKGSVELVEKTTEVFNDLLRPLSELIKTIEGIDFPRRFDELYRLLSTIENRVNLISDQINSARDDVKLKIDNTMAETKKTLIADFEKQAQQIVFIKYLNIALILGVLGLFVLQFTK